MSEFDKALQAMVGGIIREQIPHIESNVVETVLKKIEERVSVRSNHGSTWSEEDSLRLEEAFDLFCGLESYHLNRTSFAIRCRVRKNSEFAQ